MPDLNSFLSLLMPVAPGHPELVEAWLDFGVGQSPVLVPPAWKKMSGRLVFPLRDENGRLAGFSGRRMRENDTGPKYINTSREEGYQASEHLYGLWLAREAIRQQQAVWLVEGFKDAIAMQPVLKTRWR